MKLSITDRFYLWTFILSTRSAVRHIPGSSIVFEEERLNTGMHRSWCACAIWYRPHNVDIR